MKKFRVILAFIMCLEVSGCASPALRQTYPVAAGGTHPLMLPFSKSNEGVYHLSCTDIDRAGKHYYESFRGNACTPENGPCESDRIELAKAHFAHAAMANNVYRTPVSKPIFVLPSWIFVERFESAGSGLALDVYADNSKIADAKRIVIAYRGTDFDSLLDWQANLTFFREPVQYQEAREHLNALRKINPKAEIVLVGHSLGGAVALNLSLRVPNVSAVVFNPSPNAFQGPIDRNLKNPRTLMYEKGEVLDMTSGPWLRLRLPGKSHYGNYNLLDYKWQTVSPLQEHSIYQLTRALTVIAMTVGESEEARSLFRSNIPRSLAEKIDPESCAYLYPAMQSSAR